MTFRALFVAAIVLAALPATFVAGAGPLSPRVEGPTLVAQGETYPYTATVRAAAVGPVSGVAVASQVELRLDGVTIAHATLLPPTVDGLRSKPIFVSFAGVARGAHALVLVAEPGTPLESTSAPLVVSVAVPPSVPGPVVAFREPRADAILVSWTASNDDGGAPIEGYDVQRAVTDHGPWQSAALVDGTTFEDPAVIDQTIWYRAVARSLAGASAPSANASALLDGPWLPSDIAVSIEWFHACPGELTQPTDPSCVDIAPNGTYDRIDWYALYPVFRTEITDGGLPVHDARFIVSNEGKHYYPGTNETHAAGTDGVYQGWTGGMSAYGVKQLCITSVIRVTVTSLAGPSAFAEAPLRVCGV